MILIDVCAGSKELVNVPPLNDPAIATLHKLASADVAFVGNGPAGPVTVGIEVKAIGDLVSSLLNGRLNGIDGQFAKMADAYAVRWVCYYGLTRPNPSTGELQVAHVWTQKHNPAHLTLSWENYGGAHGRKQLPYAYVEKFLCSPSFTALDIRVKHCVDVSEVAVWVHALYEVWQKPWADHRAMHTFDGSRSADIETPVGTIKPATKREKQVAKSAFSLPGVGFERAWALARKFGKGEPGKPGDGGGVRGMVNAGPDEWAKVEIVDSGTGKVRRMGKVVAQTVEEAIK